MTTPYNSKHICLEDLFHPANVFLKPDPHIKTGHKSYKTYTNVNAETFLCSAAFVNKSYGAETKIGRRAASVTQTVRIFGCAQLPVTLDTEEYLIRMYCRCSDKRFLLQRFRDRMQATFEFAKDSGEN